MSNLNLSIIRIPDEGPSIIDEAANTLMSCGMYNEYDAKKKIRDCMGGVYQVSIPSNPNIKGGFYHIPVGIVGCRRVFKSEIPVQFNLKYHPQMNDAMYYIEFLHVKSDYLMADDEMILQVLELLVNTVAKDKNDAPIFVDSRCISTYIDNHIEIMEKLNFEYYYNDENGYFVKYPITNKTN